MRKVRLVVFAFVIFGLLCMGPGLSGLAYAAAQTKCPVLNNPIDKNVYVDYQGKRVYFCCSACIDDFKKDPQKYLKKMEAEGITPEKAPK